METALSQPNNLLIIAAVCILGGIALFVFTVLKRAQEVEDSQSDTSRRYHKIINNAHNEARAIIDTSSVASAGILADSKATSEHIEENLDKVLQQIAAQHIAQLKQTSDEFSKSYEEMLTALQSQLQNHTEQAIHESEDRISKTLEQYMQPIVQSASSSHSTIDQRTQEMIGQVEKEIADYKAARLAKIESEVQDLVRRTYREVLRTSIPESTQEKLVLESLEKAKIEGGLLV